MAIKKNTPSVASKVEADENIEVKEFRASTHHGDTVKHFRTAKGYSQEYMATQLNISQPKYSGIEKQEIIDEKYLETIAAILNVGIEWLRDIPLFKGYNSYHQDGNGNTNFQNTGDVNYNINNPVDPIVDAYKDTINNFKEIIDDQRTVINDKDEKILDIIDRYTQKP